MSSTAGGWMVQEHKHRQSQSSSQTVLNVNGNSCFRPEWGGSSGSKSMWWVVSEPVWMLVNVYQLWSLRFLLRPH